MVWRSLRWDVALVLGVLGICWLHAVHWAPNHDASVILVEAHKILAGGQFHQDVMETNPPLAIFLSMPGVLLGQALGCSQWAGVMLWFGLIIASSALCVSRVLARALPDVSGAWRALVLWWGLAVLPGHDFGQREHLAVCLLLPALVSFAVADIPGSLSRPRAGYTVLWLVACVGLMLKPFFALVLAAGLLARSVWRRDWRLLFGVEFRAVVSGAVVYAAAIWWWARPWLDTLALTVQAYFGYNASWQDVWAAYQSQFLLGSVAAFCLLLWPGIAMQRRFFAQLLCVAASWAALALLQQKGWSYHLLPAVALLSIALGLMAALVWRAGRRWATVPILSLMGAMGASGAIFAVDPLSTRQAQLNSPFAQAVIRHAQGRPWVAWSTAVTPAFPLVSMVEGEWASRMVCQWLIPGVLKLEARPQADEDQVMRLRTLAARMNAEDLEKHRPAVVLVQQQGHLFVSGPFDFLRFFSVDPAFRTAWSNYRRVEVVGGWAVYIRHEPPL